MNTRNLATYNPYTISFNRDPNYADIVFEREGLMTIPKSSASTIVKLLNEAFQNGVKMTLKNNQMGHLDSSVIGNVFDTPSKPTHQEEPIPINTYSKKR